MGHFVKVERRGPVAILRLDAPDTLNAIGSVEDCADLVAALRDLDQDRSISAAIVTGTGRAFSAGGNLKECNGVTGSARSTNPIRPAPIIAGVQQITRAFLDIEVPLIAAVNGHAIGLGCDLACLCDIRIAAESASFSASFIKVGIVPGDGGAWSLQRVVGYAQAAEMFFTGDRYTAAEAQAFGLVGRVVPDAALIDEAMALATRIAANPARALRLTKRLLREAQHSRIADILELSAAYQAIAHETADHKEAVDAFLAKRPPLFTGE